MQKPLTDIQQELEAREPIFHRAEFGTTRADFDAMMTEDFFEIGASGRRYSRSFILDTLEARHSKPIAHEELTPQNVECQLLAPDLYLLHYTLQQSDRNTRRTTLWQRVNDDWKIRFHQGTVIQDQDKT